MAGSSILIIPSKNKALDVRVASGVGLSVDELDLYTVSHRGSTAAHKVSIVRISPATAVNMRTARVSVVPGIEVHQYRV
jgi:hypothetical protein